MKSRIPWIIAGGVAVGLLIGRSASAAVPRVDQYRPHSPEAIQLFRAAARSAGLPVAWGSSAALHNILDSESSGWVGRPNYTFGVSSPTARASWPGIWDELKSGVVRTRSTAIGLGQLLASNYDRYAPAGRQSIGDPLGEAVAMLRYIEGRYGDPETAWRFYELPRCAPGVRSGYNTSALRIGCKPGEGY